MKDTVVNVEYEKCLASKKVFDYLRNKGWTDPQILDYLFEHHFEERLENDEDVLEFIHSID